MRTGQHKRDFSLFTRKQHEIVQRLHTRPKVCGDEWKVGAGEKHVGEESGRC